MASSGSDIWIHICGKQWKVWRSKNIILTDVLLKERCPVRFVGEGDFTFTLAYAALRENYSREQLLLASLSDSRVWAGIMSTRYEPAPDPGNMRRPVGAKPVPSLQNMQMGCIIAIATYFQEKEKREMEATIECWKNGNPLTQPLFFNNQVQFERILNIILNLPPPPIHCGVDACNIPPDLIRTCFLGSIFPPPPPPPPRVVIWFQCPWLKDKSKIGKLIEQFLVNNVRKIHNNDLMCVGIINNANYIDHYSLESILGEELRAVPKSTTVLEHYDFCGADDQLVGEILKYGYHHQGLRDIHRTNIPNHITLVFKKTIFPDLPSPVFPGVQLIQCGVGYIHYS